MKILQDHFESQQSAIVSRFRFHSCNRDAGESVTSFLARLRKLAKPCKFQSGQLDEMLRDRFVCGIQHERLQSRLLCEPGLTLFTAVEIAQAHVSAAASTAELSGRSEPADAIRRVDAASRRAPNDGRRRQGLVNDKRQTVVNDGRQAPVNDSQRAPVSDNRRSAVGGAALPREIRRCGRRAVGASVDVTSRRPAPSDRGAASLHRAHEGSLSVAGRPSADPLRAGPR